MILTPGQLYFINEQDVQTGEKSEYYKIGIVRDAEGRDSKNRLLEHQTGNPRKLCIVETLSMPAVEAIETNLHYLFARNRVMGEWMHFTERELRETIAKAKELAQEMTESLSDFESVEILKKTVSNSVILDPSPEAEDLFATIQNLKIVLKSCDEVLEKYDAYLYEAIEQGVSVEGRAKVQTRAGAKKFNESLFKSSYPDIYATLSTSVSETKGVFRVTNAPDWDFDNSTLNDDQVLLLSDLSDQIDSGDLSLEAGFILHEKHLGVLEIKKYAEWTTEFAKVKLKVLVGENQGIDGICTWKREEKQIVSFDKKKAQIDFPQEYESCVVQGAETIALIVEPRAPENIQGKAQGVQEVKKAF